MRFRKLRKLTRSRKFLKLTSLEKLRNLQDSLGTSKSYKGSKQFMEKGDASVELPASWAVADSAVVAPWLQLS